MRYQRPLKAQAKSHWRKLTGQPGWPAVQVDWGAGEAGGECLPVSEYSCPKEWTGGLSKRGETRNLSSHLSWTWSFLKFSSWSVCYSAGEAGFLSAFSFSLILRAVEKVQSFPLGFNPYSNISDCKNDSSCLHGVLRFTQFLHLNNLIL